jgi:transposase
MWTAKNRGRYDRGKLRYPSDLTDDEWALVEPLIPPARRGGNKRHVDVREVMNGIMYVLSTGCQWRAIPKDLPPRSTVHDYLDLWSYDGNRCRRLAKDWENLNRKALAFLRLASIRLMLRKLCNPA